jgi:hypothetical protein
VQYCPLLNTLALVAVITFGAASTAVAETRTVANGLEVHETALIRREATPTHMLTNESCANAQTGWKIAPESVKTEVATARMMDTGGDPDWKVEKAEAAPGSTTTIRESACGVIARDLSSSNARSRFAPAGRRPAEQSDPPRDRQEFVIEEAAASGNASTVALASSTESTFMRKTTPGLSCVKKNCSILPSR